VTTIHQQQEPIREAISTVRRVALVIPKTLWGTRRERRALAGIARRHPDARIYTPAGRITTREIREPVCEPVVIGDLGDGWESISLQPTGETLIRRRSNGIAWGLILDALGPGDVVYVLPNPDGRNRVPPPYPLGWLDGTIGPGCVANIEQADRHGASIRLITSVEPFTCFYSTAPPAAPITILRDDRGMFPIIEDILEPAQVDRLFGDCLIVWDQTAAAAWRRMGRRFFPDGLYVDGAPVTLRQLHAGVRAELQRQLTNPSMN
jgi:hypothetical protein